MIFPCRMVKYAVLGVLGLLGQISDAQEDRHGVFIEGVRFWYVRNSVVFAYAENSEASARFQKTEGRIKNDLGINLLEWF